MKYTTTHALVDAIEFTADNVDEVVAFIKEHGCDGEPQILGSGNLTEIGWNTDSITSYHVKVGHFVTYVGSSMGYLLIYKEVFNRLYSMSIDDELKPLQQGTIICHKKRSCLPLTISTGIRVIGGSRVDEVVDEVIAFLEKANAKNVVHELLSSDIGYHTHKFSYDIVHEEYGGEVEHHEFCYDDRVQEPFYLVATDYKILLISEANFCESYDIVLI